MTEPEKRPTPKVAVVGCGHWGRNLVRNFHALGALASVHDIDDAAAREASSAYSVPSRGLDEILDDDAVVGIVLATPAERHADMCRAALGAGKNVFVEKPLALTVADAERLCGMAEERGLVLMVGHLLQYHPAFEKLIEICRSGAIGAEQYVYSHRLNLGRIRTEENILWSFAPHDISMILGLLGENVETVSAMGQSYLNHDLLDVTTTHICFADNRAAHVFVSWLHPFKVQRLVVVGETGMTVFDDTLGWAEKISIYPHQVNWENGVPVLSQADREPVVVEEAEPLNRECRHFLDCLADGRTPRTDGREAVRVLRVLEAAQRSIESGKVITF